ncbi:hypothetical protein [Arhodomonas sp. SL1]|uniref:hypothetical protein n=1 Tax=Arhodomonas sp. SL1 TaxID=3425691 RepID=UPI003F880D80
MPDPTQAIPVWVAYLSALLTPTIAILGSVIGFLQWRTNRNRLKHELFDRRYEQFEVVRNFLGSIMSSGKATDERQFKYLSGTRGVRFVFDKELAEYLDAQVWRPAIELACLDGELQGVPVGEERSRNVRRQSELKRQLYHELETLDDIFAKYLQLHH